MRRGVGQTVAWEAAAAGFVALVPVQAADAATLPGDTHFSSF